MRSLAQNTVQAMRGVLTAAGFREDTYLLTKSLLLGKMYEAVYVKVL